MTTNTISVAVVGAGAAGLCATRLLARHDNESDSSAPYFDVTVFEQTKHIGGVWRYTDKVGTDENGLHVHTSMYKNLRTNLAKECMFIPDYPFPSYLPSFPKHQEVLKYLEDYATHFDLHKHIQFQTMVENIKPIPDASKRFGVKWEVTTSKVTSRQDTHSQMFDAVLVCNGQFTVPKMPDIQGLESFEGHVIHSHDYRVPDAYTDKTVIVLGGKLSGQDLCVEIGNVAKMVYLCHDHPRIPTCLPSNIEQKPGIKQCQGRMVELRDGETLQVDAIIFCTGYRFNFPFLDDSIGLTVEDRRVTPLYKHFLSTSFPSLGLVGILQYVLFFPLFYMQIQYFRSIMKGTVTLPTQVEMREEEDRDFKAILTNGHPHRYAHFLMGDRQFEYFDCLADLGGFQRLPKTIPIVFKASVKARTKDISNYRKYNYSFGDDCVLKVVKSE